MASWSFYLEKCFGPEETLLIPQHPGHLPREQFGRRQWTEGRRFVPPLWRLSPSLVLKWAALAARAPNGIGGGFV